MKKASSFPKIEELAKELSKRVRKLADGKLNVEELDSLTQQAQEVYERLVVLRYKAIEEAQDKEAKPAKPAGGIRFNFQKEEIPRNQTSLIDAIEEIDKEVKTAAVAEPIEELTDAVIDHESAPEPEVAEVQIQEELESADDSRVTEDRIDKEAAEQSSNYIPSEEEFPQSVADKLTLSPIDNIKAEVGLNQKFRFINELFDGDAEAYSILVESLDSAGSKENAMEAFDKSKHEQNWEDESEVAEQLSQLVERRYA